MNEDNTDPQPWIDPALEARLVAHVLGESSAFEAAELERLLAENPELALFKRRIEAVHSLASSAAKPDSPKLQLSADKRQKLLEIIGHAPAAPSSKAIFVMPNTPWWKSEVLIRVAVCLVMVALVLGIFSTMSLYNSTGTDFRFEGERGAFAASESPTITLPQGMTMGQASPSASATSDGLVVFRKGGDGVALRDEERPAAILPQSVTTSVSFETVPQAQTASVANNRNLATAAPEVPQSNAPMLGDVPLAGRLFRTPENQPAAAPVTVAPGAIVTSGMVTPATPTGFDDENERTRVQAGGMAMATQNMASPVEAIDAATPSEPAAQPSRRREANQEALDRLSKRAELIATSEADETVSWDGKAWKGSRQELATLTEKLEQLPMQKTQGDEAKSVGDSDSAYMYRGAIVMEPGQSSKSDQASSASVATGSHTASYAVSANSIDALLVGVAGKDIDSAKEAEAEKSAASSPQPDTTTYPENVINQPVFYTRDGKASFDGFINYGSPITTVTTPEPTQERIEEVKKLLTEANAFAEDGRYDLAYKRYEQVLAADPYNIASRRGMEQVTQARQKYASSAYNETRSSMLTQADNGWQLPVRKFDIGTTTIVSNPEIDRSGAKLINRKLDEIVIPRIDFEDVTLRDALDFLKQRALQLDTEQDPSKRGVNIVLDVPEAAPEAGARVTLALTDIPLRAAIDYVSKAASLKTKVEPYAVAIVPLSATTDVLITKEIKVPPGFVAALPAPRSASAPLPGAGGATAPDSLPAVAARSGAREYLENSGVTFPPGATAYFIASSGKLIVRNTQANLDLIETITAKTGQADPKPVARGKEILAADQPFSTFSLHVSDVSFQLARDALSRGTVPDPDRIRTEEFYNAFDYNDPAPATREEVTCRIESCAHPYLQQRDLVRLAVKVAAAGRAAGQPLRLTILLDTSGSMEREDRAESVRRALKSLVTLLGPQDRVTLIGFARTPRLLAEDVPGDQAEKLVESASRTPSEGGTNLEEALSLASKMALKSRLAGAQNRIVLLTDGAANLGDANPERLARQIESTRQQGISFDACGVGAKGLNDGILEALTRKGDGRYYYLNSPEDADAGFARQLAGAFRPAAENVKVQVVFNPARVSRYRLLGFEKHLLKQQDFRNDKVQAAELSAEEAGVALYQIETLPEGSGEIGEVFVRFRDPAKGTMVERSWTMPYEAKVTSFDQASPSLQLATVSALLAERLRGDEQVDLSALAPAIPNLRNSYSGQQRVAELIQMFETLRR